MNIKPIETYYNGYRFRSRLEARWAVFLDALGVEYEYEPEGFELPSGKRYLPDFKVKCYGTRGGFFNYGLPCEHCEHRKAEVNLCCLAAPWSYFCELFNPMNCYKNGLPYPDWITTRDSDQGEIIACKRQKCSNPFDLYIEVKGVFTEEDVCKIKEFAAPNADWDDPSDWVKIENPILVVGNIPEQGHSYNPKEEGFNGVYTFNYCTIDGDYFGAYPAAHNGQFYLWGADSSYINTGDVEDVERAYDISRQARFEHGETPRKETSA